MKTAMILAAGRGERLKPLTELYPKALCRVQGKPLIEHHVINLAKAGFEKIIINHAYLGGQIRNYLGDGSRYGLSIYYSPEPPGGLETGGGIIQALRFFENSPFITVNADIYTDFDFSQLRSLSNIESLHLVLVNKNPLLDHHGDFGLVKDQLNLDSKEYTFSGIACYHPQIFKAYQLGRFSVTPLIHHYAKTNQATAILHEGLWHDVGSLERLDAVNCLNL